jgi:hypothetical protein
VSDDGEFRHPRFALSAQVFRGSEEGKLGSAYLIGPGIFLTALHCAVDGEVVPAGDVTCAVRLFEDYPRTKQDPAWKFRPARLAWPPAGARVDNIDAAVLVVDQQHRTPAMNRTEPLAAHIPKRPQNAEAVGYPNWKQAPKIEQWAPHRTHGVLESDQSLPGILNDFDIAGATPEDEKDWGGMSGSVLFARNTNVALGVVSTRGRSKNNSLLGATLFHDLAGDEAFWSITRLPKPSRDDAVLRRAKAQQQSPKAMKLKDFLYLFDRKPQHDRWRFIVHTALKQDPYPILIVPIIAALEDEASYLMRRLECVLEARFPARQAVYRNTDTISWVYDDVSDEEAVEQMLFRIQEQLRIEDALDLRDFAKSGGTFRRTLESGTVPRAFRMELTIEDDAERTSGILRLLFERLAMLGTFDSPLALFISLDKTTLPVESHERPLDHPRIRTIGELAKTFPTLAWQPLTPLGPCTSADLDAWSTDLEALHNPLLDLTRLSTGRILSEIHVDKDRFHQPFAFQQARFALEKLDL